MTRIRASFNKKQLQSIEQETGIEIKEPADVKAALKVLIPDFPDDESAGAPKGNKNARSRK